MGVGPDGLHSRHWLRRGRHRPIGKRCLRPHLPSSSVCCVLADISARVYTSRGERSSEKSRLTCLAQVGGHPHPGTPPPRRIQQRATRLRARAQYAIRDSPRRDTDDHATGTFVCDITSTSGLRLTYYKNRYAPLTCACDFTPIPKIFRNRRSPFRVSFASMSVTLLSELLEII